MAVKLSLKGAPLVIKKRKKFNVRMGGEFSGGLDDRLIGKKDSITVDMTNQGYADINYLLKHITIEETKVQVKLDNTPSRFAVDNKENVPLHLAQRKTEVIYGNVLDQAMIKFVERSLMSAISSLAPTSETKALGTMGSWEWLYVENPKKDKTAVKLPEPRKLKSMRYRSYLILKPTSNMVGVANMFAARADAGWGPEKWNAKGRSGGKGFMSQSVNKMKRSNLLKSYIIHAGFTNKHTVPGEVYRSNSSEGPLTPYIIIYAKRNKRYKRIR